MDEKERARALESALGQIEKQFGKGSILRLGSKDAIVPVSVISTGSISLDAALGVGRIAARPRSARSSVRSPPVRRRSRCRWSPKRRRRAASRRSSTWSTRSIRRTRRKLGVDVDNLLVSQPDYGEQALEITGAPDRLGTDRRAGGGFGGGAGAQGGARRRDGRQPHGAAGAADVAGAAQADRRRSASRARA